VQFSPKKGAVSSDSFWQKEMDYESTVGGAWQEEMWRVWLNRNVLGFPETNVNRKDGMKKYI